MVKCKTIEQFKLLELIKKNFYIDKIYVEPVGDKSLKVIDYKGDSMVFNYDEVIGTKRG